jgi:hypothetical protein
MRWEWISQATANRLHKSQPGVGTRHAMQVSDVARNQITAGSAAAADNKHLGSPGAEDLTVKKGLGSEHVMAKGEHKGLLPWLKRGRRKREEGRARTVMKERRGSKKAPERAAKENRGNRKALKTGLKGKGGKRERWEQ